MKRAQNVAQAVVKTRSSLSSWSCMGPRRRTVGSSSNSKEEDSPETETSSLVTERPPESLMSKAGDQKPRANKVQRCSSRGESGADETDEEEELTEGELWHELEMKLQREESEVDLQAREEEAAAAKEITEEEKVLVDAVESKSPVSSSDFLESHHFYPPGRIMHIVSSVVAADDATDSGHDGPTVEERVGIYETPRDLYSKLRLSRTMINDHYMPMYKKMMELLINELDNDDDDSGCVM